MCNIYMSMLSLLKKAVFFFKLFLFFQNTYFFKNYFFIILNYLSPLKVQPYSNIVRSCNKECNFTYIFFECLTV